MSNNTNTGNTNEPTNLPNPVTEVTFDETISAGEPQFASVTLP